MGTPCLEIESRAESEARIEYKYRERSDPRKIVMVHTWTSPLAQRCFCGHLHRDDPKLVSVHRDDVKNVPGRLCRRCTWYKPDLVNSASLF
jgi:hypothetical protein